MERPLWHWAAELPPADRSGARRKLPSRGLNLLLGSVGVAGGIVERREKVEPAAELAAVADHSIGVLIVDEAASGCSMPWPLVSRKLSDKALVVSLSPFLSSFARRAIVRDSDARLSRNYAGRAVSFRCAGRVFRDLLARVPRAAGLDRSVSMDRRRRRPCWNGSATAGPGDRTPARG